MYFNKYVFHKNILSRGTLSVSTAKRFVAVTVVGTTGSVVLTIGSFTRTGTKRFPCSASNPPI